MELLQQCKAGEEEAFREVVNRHEKQVIKTVYGMLGDHPAVKDVAQEAFIRFFKSLDNFRGDAKLSTYLSRIAINLSLNELKRQQKRSRWMIFSNRGKKEINVEDLSSNPEKMDTKELVHCGLQILEPEFRSVIILRLLDGYSVKETSEILQVPIGTVASRLARGQKKLKSILEKIQ